jgi:glycosyltransferase
MKISIITVAYNSAKTIADTLRSVAIQTYPDIEQIVIDGASSDETLSLVRQHGTRVTHCVSEPDRGIYDAMNKGLRLVSGDFVGFLNADDILADPEAVSRMVKTLQAGHADAIYSDLDYVRHDNLDVVVRHWQGGNFTTSGLKYGWMPPHPTFYIRRVRLEEIGEFDLKFRIAADYDFMLRCLRCQDLDVAYSRGVFVRMRVGGVSNCSIRAILRKSREDLWALRRNGVGSVGALICKNLRKLPQFLGALG